MSAPPLWVPRHLKLPPGVRLGFTSRHGGVSSGARESLTLARGAHDESDEALLENWRRALAALGGPERLDAVALVNQVHGAEVLEVKEPLGPLRTLGDADAMVTTRRGVVLAVRVADCVPIILVARDVVAVAHAGWRGVAGRVVAATVAEMRRLGDPRQPICAAIGPCISGVAYEVGLEVVERIEATGVPCEDFATQRQGSWYADLRAAVQTQLRDAGVTSMAVHDGCTTGPDYFSWRGDGSDTGRQAGLVVLA